MDTMKLKMVSLILFSGFLLNSQNIIAQDAKLTRQELKEIRAARLNANYYRLDTLLNSKSFVLVADYLRDKEGVLVPVVSGLNFIKVDKTEGVLQTGSNSGRGYNGVGGVTAQGSLGRWEVIKDNKKMAFTIRFSLLTNIGNYDVLMFVRADNNASATITGLSSGWLTWDGEIVPIAGSRIFTGQETY